MGISDLKNLFGFAEVFSPLILYLVLLLIIRLVLEKLNFLKKPPFKNAFPLIKNILHVFIFVTIILYTLGIVGIDIHGIITGLGLFSFAIGFALKDVISNFFAGLSLFFYGPFKIGDDIIIDDYRGTVSKMDIRYTVLKLGKKLCYIPNSYMMETKIIVIKGTSLGKPLKRDKKEGNI